MWDACCSVLNHVQCTHGTQGFAAQILQTRGRTRGQNSIGFMLCSCSAQTWHIHLAFLSISQPPLPPTPLPQNSAATGASEGHRKKQMRMSLRGLENNMWKALDFLSSMEALLFFKVEQHFKGRTDSGLLCVSGKRGWCMRMYWSLNRGRRI